MTNLNKEMLAKLDGYDGYEIDASDDQITVSCNNPESFDVSIFAFDEQFQVNFAGWHEVFDDQEEAMRCFAFGLSQQCRLEVVKRGKMECSWTMQFLQDDTWVDDSVTGMFLIPFWRPKQIEYRFNLIKRKPC
ncbi:MULTISPECIES: hypothetical protein [Halocynthiibacter]|uniref:Uncharacterized protein n=1 Tax=Halocynthiibacter halioticoli TaxID=2986804 RepID=A0AAE3J120_9RHOB|nr:MULTISPECIES: hypothetical protein [Halocynthiibacter]MCV6825790.1 hypothetical protein [Halocynthiibacter halioticoli]MCW4058791.1 hypothetical protein [Halocynthiibacter sp. SDUM655004]